MFSEPGLGPRVKSTKLKLAVAVWTSEPLVPVAVRVKVPAAFALHETVAVPDPVTLLGVITPQVRPAGTLSTRVTIPLKPFRGVIVIVEVPDWVALTVAGEEAAMVKSCEAGALTTTVIVVVCDVDPLVPLTVTV